MEPHLIQRSNSWFNYRRGKVGASDAGALLNLNPFKNSYDVWLSKQDGYKEEDNVWMQRGRDLEPTALRLFEAETGFLMSPKVLESKEEKWMIASLDGYEIDGKCAVEIKCGGKKLHLNSIHGEIPKYYLAQMQHQMYVAELDEIYYCSYHPDHLVKQLYIELIKRDDDFISDMVEKESDFYHNHMLTGIPPGIENSKSKYEDFKEVNSEQWASLANEYRQLDDMEKRSNKKKQEIRDLLVQIAQSENAKGNGIILQKMERKGIINYQNIPILKTMDLEEYRKPGSTYWQVKEMNNGPFSSTI